MSPCLSTVLLIGYLFTLYPNNSHTTDINGHSGEIQSCAYGLGVHAGGTSAGMARGGVQFGLGTTIAERLEVIIQPFVGAAYMPNVRELPLEVQFEVGAKVMALAGDRGIVVEYLHLSNAGLKEPNIGKDAIILSGVWRF